jgi:hypothetical protein
MMTPDQKDNLMRVLTKTLWRFHTWIESLCAFARWGCTGYSLQLRNGLGVTGLHSEASLGT